MALLCDPKHTLSEKSSLIVLKKKFTLKYNAKNSKQDALETRQSQAPKLGNFPNFYFIFFCKFWANLLI